MASATFADDGTYCVVRRAGERTTTSSGTYTWTGWKLTLAPEGGSAPSVSGHRRFDGKLVLTETAESGPITAILEKQKDEASR